MALEQHQAIITRTNQYFRDLGLQPFLLALPLHGVTAAINQQGIRGKILKNRSHVVTEYNPSDEYAKESPESISRMHAMVDSLVSPDMRGFVLVIAEVLLNNDYRPVAGSVVELLDDHERSIKGIWCRRSLPWFLSQSLLNVTCMRLFAHAFELSLPGGRNRTAHKLVSTLDQTCLTFPRDASDFLTNELAMSKHWETEEDAGTHNDHPTLRCKCQKLCEMEGAWQFWGISESRFLKMWKSHGSEYVPKTVPPELVALFSHRRQSKTPNVIHDNLNRTNGEGSSSSFTSEKRITREAAAAMMRTSSMAGGGYVNDAGGGGGGGACIRSSSGGGGVQNHDGNDGSVSEGEREDRRRKTEESELSEKDGQPPGKKGRHQ